MAALPVIALAGTALGGVTSAIGASQAAEGKAKSYEYAAGVADLNKKISSQNADYSRQVGEVKAQGSGMKTQFQIGKMKANQGASGLDVNTGSAAGVRDSQQLVGQFDQATIRSNAARTAYGFDTEAVKYGAEADMDRRSASSSREAGKLNVMSSILGTATSVASKWLQGSSAGMFGDTASKSGGGYKPTSSWDE